MDYNLPNSPEYRCLDRFSIIADPEPHEDDNGNIPFWLILQDLLNSPMKTSVQIVELLDTIAVTLKGTSGPAGDYGLLKSAIDADSVKFFEKCWPCITSLALELPSCFPGATIPVLLGNLTRSSLCFSRRQVAVLVAHQFLCTLAKPLWKDDDCYDFAVWYNSNQRHPEACSIYLSSLLAYFSRIAEKPGFLDGMESWQIHYQLHSAHDRSNFSDLNTALSNIEIVILGNYDTLPEQLGLPLGAAVVSANRYIGFGQSATQEEIHVGCSPEACPAVLLTPPLGENQVLVIKGAESMVNIAGQRRNIHIAPFAELATSPDWSQRTMLFMDALEIDMQSDENGLPDLKSGNIDREIQKACLAFSSGKYNFVNCPLWGCGAFGGDPYVKVMALWCAASISKTELRIICDKTLLEIAKNLQDLVNQRSSFAGVGSLRKYLSLVPVDLKRYETYQWMKDNLQNAGKS